MAGTTNRAERLAAAAAFCLALAGRMPTAVAATVPDALVVSLAAEDLSSLAKGLLDGPLAAPLEGRADVRLTQDLWFFTVGVEGLSYRAHIADLTVQPGHGRVRAHAKLDGLEVNIEKIFFNASGSLYCRDMPLSSGDGEVPVGIEMSPRAANRNFDLGAESVRVALSSRNYRPGEPAECHTIWGFNWLVRHALPLAARLLRPVLEHEMEKRLLAAAREVAGEMGDYLDAEITLPFSPAPMPAFYGTLGIWPSTVVVTPEALTLKLAADLSFDPDLAPRAAPRRNGRGKSLPPFAAELLPSWVGLKVNLFRALLAEANRAGLFQMSFDDLTDVAALARVLPDAATRFGPEQTVSLEMRGAQSTTVILEPQGPGGIPIIEACLEGLDLLIKVDGEDYYALRSSMRFRFQAGYSVADAAIVLDADRFEVRPSVGHFAAGLDPAPEVTRFDRQAFRSIVRTLEDQLVAEGGRLLSLSLPDVSMGSRTLDFLGSSVRDGYLSIDAAVVSKRRFASTSAD